MGKLRADGPGVNLILQTASRAAAWRLLLNVAIMSGSGCDTGLSAEKHDFRDSHSIGRQLAMVVRWSTAHCAACGGQRDPGLPVPVTAWQPVVSHGACGAPRGGVGDIGTAAGVTSCLVERFQRPRDKPKTLLLIYQRDEVVMRGVHPCIPGYFPQVRRRLIRKLNATTPVPSNHMAAGNGTSAISPGRTAHAWRSVFLPTWSWVPLLKANRHARPGSSSWVVPDQ